MTINTVEATVVDLVDAWATKTPNAIAVEREKQTLTFSALRDASLHVSKALLSRGIAPGDKIPILSRMSLELIPAILGILRVGACYVPIDMAKWSDDRINATIADILPQIAIATIPPGVRSVPDILYFEEHWLRSPFEEGSIHNQLDSIRQNLDAKALVYINFTSGTTGKPKGVMIYHQALYRVAVLATENSLNVSPGQRLLSAFSISFDAFAATVWLSITRGGVLVMADWSTFPEVATTCDIMIATPSMLATLDPTGPFEKLRVICLGAEAPNLDIARQWITSRRRVISTYGPSEATINISFGEIPDNSEPDLGVISPGIEVFIVDDDLQECDIGEILISGPCLAAGYLNNPELTAKKFFEWNGKRVYRTGDRARRTKKGLSWVGRADRIVKNRGFLVNLETEVEPAMLRFPDVREASACIWRGKLMGFVQPSSVNLEDMRVFMEKNFDPFVVPDEILALEEFPITIHGKIDRAALNARLDDRMVGVDRELENMVCSSARDALRWSFAKCLQVPLADLDDASSFSRLGGHSLTAITLCALLGKRSYIIPVLSLIKLDTIGRLVDELMRLDDQAVTLKWNGRGSVKSKAVPVTDMHKVMLTQSRSNPEKNCLLARIKFKNTGSLVPTPTELYEAWNLTLASHSIFKTRYDMQTWTLHDTDSVNLDWKVVRSTAEDFDQTICAVEEQIWAEHLSLQSLPDSSLERPYCHMSCVYAPDRAAIGFVWKIHHVLIDIFSFDILLHDLDRALAKDQLVPGPLFKDYAIFMEGFKADKIETATAYWTHMMKPMCEKTQFDFQRPRTKFKGNSWLKLSSPTKETVESVNTSVSRLGISSATLITAAWALTLNRYTQSKFASFYLSRSGRMVPWPPAPSLVGAMNCRVPFGVSIPEKALVRDWLSDMHDTLLTVAELENLCQSLDRSIYPEQHFKTGVQAFLNIDMSDDKEHWEINDRATSQADLVGLLWRVESTDDGAVQTILELDQRFVDLEWAQELAVVAVQMLEMLTRSDMSITLGTLI